jgi:hypothetical protein
VIAPIPEGAFQTLVNTMAAEWKFPVYTELTPAVQRFFEILDTREESDSGTEFYPVKIDFKDFVITSVRVYKTAELKSLLPQMKSLANVQRIKREDP